MSDPARNADLPGCTDFPGDEAPALENELICVCGQPEGLHRADGTCTASGCHWFVPFDDAEEHTRPDIVVEYEPGCEPAEVR